MIVCILIEQKLFLSNIILFQNIDVYNNFSKMIIFPIKSKYIFL